MACAKAKRQRSSSVVLHEWLISQLSSHTRLISATLHTPHSSASTTALTAHASSMHKLLCAAAPRHSHPASASQHVLLTPFFLHPLRCYPLHSTVSEPSDTPPQCSHSHMAHSTDNEQCLNVIGSCHTSPLEIHDPERAI